MPKYLLLQRSAPGPRQTPPSPAQMQEMYAAFNAWKDRFKDQIVDLGGRLQGGKRVGTDGVTDGPFVEVKEIIGGYMIVDVANYDAAIEIARGCPGMITPGSSCEVREIAAP
ncbi:MAG: YciI family protein [Kofleriaceae bacterium]